MSRVPHVRAVLENMGTEAFCAWQVELVRVRPIPMRLADRLLRADALRPSEVRALGAISRAPSQAAAALELGIRPLTLKRQLRDASSRLGARNTPHAVAIAIRAGII